MVGIELLGGTTVNIGIFLSEVDCKYQDGMVIFKEGEPGHSAFVLVSGQVEILKKTTNGLVRLAVISPGEVFGEMGVVDRSNRSVTAKAVGDVVVEVVDQPGLLSPYQNTTDISLNVTDIAKTLRQSNQILVSPASRKLLIDGQNKPNIWTLIGGLIAKRRNKNRFLEIRVMPLLGDEDGSSASRIASILANEPEVRVTILPDEFLDKDPDTGGYNLQSVSSFGHILLQREKADLLIFGEVNPISTVLLLRFLSRKTETDQPGQFLVTDHLSLPKNFKPEYDKLLYTVAVAAIVPRSETYRLMMHPLLVNGLEAAQEAGSEPPMELSLIDQASIDVCYGHIAASIGNHLSDRNSYQRAINSYQSAVENISSETDKMEWANIHYHLAHIRHELGDKNRDKELLEIALESYNSALEFYTRDHYPWEWALLQSRMGGLFYRLDSINSDTEILKMAVTAFQSSLRVINRKVFPTKWGEVKNSLGQALQVWGDAVRNIELLELAVKCCREALEVRSREETPLFWAATQNNLGSALFLLGRQTNNVEPLENSTLAFGKALSIYHVYAATRLRKVTERNFARVEELLNKMRSRRLTKVDWDDEASEMRGDQGDGVNEHTTM